MADIHEEAQFGFAHLLGMDMCLQAQAVLLTVMAVGDKLPGKKAQDKGIEEISPCGTVPGTVHNHGEAALRRLHAVALGFYAKTVGAWRQMGERDLIVTGRERLPVFTVNTIEVDDVLGVLIGQRGELDGEGIVVITQFKVGTGVNSSIGDLIAP